MRKILFLLTFLVFCNCQNFGQLKMIADLPKKLEEVSGNEYEKKSRLIWMPNDGGNKPKIYGFTKKGKLKKVIYVNAKNKDWEDITSDDEGNIYIGDFGNNDNERKKLKIYKVDKKYLDKEVAEVEEIEFEYEDQEKYPPKKKKRFFDAESFFYYNNHFYIFTKSRVKKDHGKTSLYKVPAVAGKHEAKFIAEFDNGRKDESWITSADISFNKKKVVLLSQKNILVFTDFNDDNFFSGNVKKYPLEHYSQKEGICFKTNNVVYITDERSGGEGGNLYEFTLN